MESLHSYWRMEYVKAPKEDEGFQDLFSKLHQTDNDKEALILWRSSFNYLVLNKFPYNPGHLLAIPYRSVANLEDLSEEESNDLMATITKGKQIVDKTFQPDGFNIGFNFGSAAGAGITAHLHCHIVPRWEGDTNFMPVIGKTRVLPQALTETWEILKKHC